MKAKAYLRYLSNLSNGFRAFESAKISSRLKEMVMPDCDDGENYLY